MQDSDDKSEARQLQEIDEWQRTYTACERPFQDACAIGDLAQVQQRAPLATNIGDGIVAAARCGHASVLPWLIAERDRRAPTRANPDATLGQALCNAVANRYLDAMNVLLDNGARAGQMLEWILTNSWPEGEQRLIDMALAEPDLDLAPIAYFGRPDILRRVASRLSAADATIFLRKTCDRVRFWFELGEMDKIKCDRYTTVYAILGSLGATHCAECVPPASAAQ